MAHSINLSAWDLPGIPRVWEASREGLVLHCTARCQSHVWGRQVLAFLCRSCPDFRVPYKSVLKAAISAGTLFARDTYFN